MIHWAGVGAGALWIVGLAVLLAALSRARWRSRPRSGAEWDWRSRPRSPAECDWRSRPRSAAEGAAEGAAEWDWRSRPRSGAEWGWLLPSRSWRGWLARQQRLRFRAVLGTPAYQAACDAGLMLFSAGLACSVGPAWERVLWAAFALLYAALALIEWRKSAHQPCAVTPGEAVAGNSAAIRQESGDGRPQGPRLRPSSVMLNEAQSRLTDGETLAQPRPTGGEPLAQPRLTDGETLAQPRLIDGETLRQHLASSQDQQEDPPEGQPADPLVASFVVGTPVPPIASGPFVLGTQVPTASTRAWRGWLATWVQRAELWWVLALIPLLLFPGRWSAWAVAAIALLWAMRLAATGRLSLRTPLDWPMLALMLMLPVTVWASADAGLTRPALYHLLAGIALFYAVVNWVTTPQRLAIAAAVWVCIGVGVATLAPLAATDWGSSKLFNALPILARLPLRGKPLFSEDINANVLAGGLVLVWPVAVALLPAPFGISSWKAALVRLCLIASLLWMTAILLLTQSRGAFLAVAVATAVMAALRWPPLRWLALLACAALIVLLWRGGAAQVQRWAEELSQTDTLSSLAGREEVWSRALYMLEDFPYTGIGLGTFDRVQPLLYPFFLSPAEEHHAHNLFLQAAVDLGLPGLVAYLALLLGALYATWQAFHPSPLRRAEGLGGEGHHSPPLPPRREGWVEGAGAEAHRSLPLPPGGEGWDQGAVGEAYRSPPLPRGAEGRGEGAQSEAHRSPPLPPGGEGWDQGAVGEAYRSPPLPRGAEGLTGEEYRSLPLPRGAEGLGGEAYRSPPLPRGGEGWGEGASRHLALGLLGSQVAWIVHGLLDAGVWASKLAFLPWFVLGLGTVASYQLTVDSCQLPVNG